MLSTCMKYNIRYIQPYFFLQICLLTFGVRKYTTVHPKHTKSEKRGERHGHYRDIELLPIFLRGTQTTVIVSLITALLLPVLGCSSRCWDCQDSGCAQFAKPVYHVIRGTPLLVQLYIVYYQLHTSFRGRRVPFWAWSWRGSCPVSRPCP